MAFKYFVFLALATTSLAYACTYDDWGEEKRFRAPSQATVAEGGIEAIIQFHREVISPTDGPRSHYFPSSSQYMLNAIRKYGSWRGFELGCDRLLRENDELWIYPILITAEDDRLKFDPVP